MEAEKSLLFCKQKMYEYGNKPSRYLANLVREKTQSRAIPTVKDHLGNRLHRNKDINTTFYENLYKSETNIMSKQNMLNFLSNTDLPRISSEDRELLDNPIF